MKHVTPEIIAKIENLISKYQIGGQLAEIRPDNRPWIRREVIDPARTWVMTRPIFSSLNQFSLPRKFKRAPEENLVPVFEEITEYVVPQLNKYSSKIKELAPQMHTYPKLPKYESNLNDR